MKQLNKAIAGVMAEVQRQEAKDKNKFSDYKYTSVDDYKDHIRPIMAKCGLAIRSNQLSFTTEELPTKSGKSVVARFDLAFWLAHESGEEEQPENITVMLPFVGAQTTGQARSYAQKEWLKSKFLASSGDKTEEADALAQDEYISVKTVKFGPTDIPKEEGDPSAAKSKKAWGVLFDAMKHQKSTAELNRWWAASEKEIRGMNAQFRWDFFKETIYQGLRLSQKKLEVDLFWSFHEDRFAKLKEQDIIRYEELEEAMLNKVDKLERQLVEG